MKDKSSFPIGVFDSGLGGLTVAKELMKQFPNESLVYFGDTARVPYGTKSKDAIIQFSVENTAFLITRNVKLVVVACNSSSSYALAKLKEDFRAPIIGVIEPGAKKAIDQTRNGKIGVIATTATIKSGKYEEEIWKLNPNIKVFSQACPLFVPLVEEGWLDKKVVEDIAEEYLAPLKKAKIDTLILGCTHYPLLKPILKKVMGENVCLVDSAKAVVEEVKKVMTEENLLHKGRISKYDFIVSDRPQDFSKVAKNFLGREIDIQLRKE